MGKAATSDANDWPCDVLRRGDVLGEGHSRYRVTEYMGEGGCGAVYAAEDVQLAEVLFHGEEWGRQILFRDGAPVQA